LKQYLDSPEVAIKVLDHTKEYYLVTQVAGQPESVCRMAITGNDTTRDAVACIDGLLQLTINKVWIVRPNPHDLGGQQILPVDWKAIVQGTQTATNYSILPGDRVCVAAEGDPTAQGSTVREQTAGRNYNRTRNGL
jgi:polysaccharide biosynthesis/export protein